MFTHSIHQLCHLYVQVGNEMVANGIKQCQMISYMVTLALVTPIGMIIGIILTIHVDGQSGNILLLVPTSLTPPKYLDNKIPPLL